MATVLDAYSNSGTKFRVDMPPVGLPPTGSKAFTIYISQDLIDAMELTKATLAEPEMVDSSVKAHTRKQYWGDSTPVSVPARVRSRLEGGELSNGTLPGQNLYIGISQPQGVGPNDTKEIQITFTGTFANAYRGIKAKAAGLVESAPVGSQAWIRSPAGERKFLNITFAG